MYTILWQFHGILMTAAFLFMTAGVIINLRFKGKKWRLKYHRMLGGIGSSLGLIALVLAVLMIQTAGGYHLRSTHAVIGALTFLLMMTVPALGASLKKVKNKKSVKKVHATLGFTVLTLMVITIILGLRYVGIL